MNEQANRALAEAIRLAEHGYKLTPVTITRLDSGKKAARFHRGWRHEDSWSSDPQLIRQWWVDHPDTSFALGGAANGIEGVDLDVKPEQNVNAVEWWGAQGLPLSPLVQWTPSGGMHLIWSTGPDRALPQDVSAVAAGVDTRNRGGLFFAAGAYVLDEPGHYEIAGELPKLVDLARTPPVVLDLFANATARTRPDRAVDGRIVLKDIDFQRRVTEAALEKIRGHDRATGGYRAKLQGAALLFGRVVEQNQLYPTLTLERAEVAILDAHRSVWGDAVWPENLKDVRDGLADGPRLERWRVPGTAPETAGVLESPGFTDPVHDRVQRSSPEQSNSEPSTDGATGDVWPGEAGYDPDANAEKRRLELDAAAIELEARKRMARRVVSASERDPIRVLSGLAFLSGEELDYLVPPMLYRSSTAKIYGPPGGTKSYLLLDLALALATGRPWRGQRLGRHRVHYVMAEGEPVNRLRARGWMHHHDVDAAELEGWLTVIPQGVLLTPEGVADYLVQVEADGPALVLLDTKNAMMDGDENSASDVAVMIRAMRAIRDAAAGACVVLVDHTGLSDESRGRGSGAVTGAMDTEILVSCNSTGLASAKVTRDKGSEPGHEILYRLQGVEDMPGLKPNVRAPAVCVVAERGDVLDISEAGEVWATAGPRLPGDVEEWKGIGRASVRELARFMRYSTATQQDGAGFSFTDALRAMQGHYKDERGQPLHKRDTVQRAWNALAGSELNRLAPASVGGKWPSLGHALWVARPNDPK